MTLEQFVEGASTVAFERLCTILLGRKHLVIECHLASAAVRQTTDTDTYLLAGMALGVEEAWGRYYRLVREARHWEPDDRAHDVAVDLFLNGRIFGFLGRSSFVSWLRSIRHRTLRPSGALREVPTVPCGELEPGEQVARVELHDVLRTAVQRLPARQRQALHLRFWREWTLQAIGRELDLGHAETVRRELGRAMRKVRGRIGDAGDGTVIA